jgi:hypothetical protein
MHDEDRLPVLRREVMPPPSSSSGWGLIAISATAMSFALAGSLLMMRATAAIARERPAMPALIDAPPTLTVHAHLVHVHEVPPPAASADVDAACSGPVYHASGDGRAEAVFELCPPRQGHVTRVVAD